MTEEKKEVKKEEKKVEEKRELNIEELKNKLEECEKLKNEYLSCWQRERANFLNYKKEEMERVGELLKCANEAFILKTLTILDNFEIIARQNFLPENLDGQASPTATQLGGQEKERIKKVIEGFLQIKKQIQDFLKGQGVEEIKTEGEIFNPNLHEVVEEVEPAQISSCPQVLRTSVAGGAKIVAGKEIKSGVIIEEVQKGYKINSRLLRPAKVRITK